MGKKQGTHAIHRLSKSAIERGLTTPGNYADGGGLLLQVSASGARSWIYRYMLNGRERYMGLGPLHSVTLDEARELAATARRLRTRGIDPIEAREAAKDDQREAEQAAIDAQGKTWRYCCETYIREKKEPELRNVKHAAQWLSTLTTYTFPLLATRAVASITIEDVHAVLKDIWLTKNETASRVRGRMEAVLGWATVLKYRSGANPAEWGGALEHLLAKRTKQVTQERPHPALPYLLMPQFMVELRKSAGMSARALELLILTAQRTGPIVLALWDEIDWERKVWMASAEHMKGDYPHRAPLSSTALALLTELKKHARAGCPFIFHNAGEPMSENAMYTLIGKMHKHHPWLVDPKLDNARITPHGFRSTFTDWAAETTQFEPKAYDKALAHKEKNQTVAAYLRGDMLEKRRPLMEAWARFVNNTQQVVALPSAA